MQKNNLISIVLIVILIVTITYFLFAIISPSKQQNTTIKKTPIFTNEVEILVATKNINLGQQLQKLDLAWQQWPIEATSPEHIIKGTSNIDYYINMIAKSHINKNDPILRNNIIQTINRNLLSSILKPEKRAIAIEVNEVTGVGGFIFPGDNVDIIATMSNQDNESNSTVIAADILVIAIDQITSIDASERAKIVKTITVEVSREQATTITQAQINGTITIILQGLLK